MCGLRPELGRKAATLRAYLPSTPRPFLREPDRLAFVEQVDHINRERHGNALKNEDGRITHTALDARDVAAIEPAVGGKIFLIDFALCPEAPNIPANALADFHRAGMIGPCDLYAHDL